MAQNKKAADKPARVIVEKKKPSYQLELEKMEAQRRTLPNMQGLLRVYNTITVSQHQFTRRRNELKNSWPQLFEFLESASGRDVNGTLPSFDPHWHRMDLGIGPIDLWDDDPDFEYKPE